MRYFGNVVLDMAPTYPLGRWGGKGISGSSDKFYRVAQNQMPEPRKVCDGQLDRSGSNPGPRLRALLLAYHVVHSAEFGPAGWDRVLGIFGPDFDSAVEAGGEVLS